MAEKTIREALDEHAAAWMAIPGVTAAGIGRCDDVPCITVFVAKLTDELRARLPGEIDGFPVVVEETGEIRAVDSD